MKCFDTNGPIETPIVNRIGVEVVMGLGSNWGFGPGSVSTEGVVSWSGVGLRWVKVEVGFGARLERGLGLWWGCGVMLCDSNDRIGVDIQMRLGVEMCDSDDRVRNGVMCGNGGAGSGLE